MKAKSIDIRMRYDLSWNGEEQLKATCDNNSLCSSDDEQVIDGNDIMKYIRNLSEIYLVYWYFKLQEADLLSFACVKLPTSMVVTTTKVSPTRFARDNRWKAREKEEEYRNQVTQEMSKLSKELNHILYVFLMETRDEYEEKVMELELKLQELNEE